ncbi:MAG: hypothetical protein HY561_02195 [Gemmatimonadetes bacterium]|nr:hypothetical protein [Gemmatimonadota bacterium]
MERLRTKEAAEAALRELPSVLGASVREDIRGHPREVHVLIRAGPDVRRLARDVRDLLEERLGIPIDQRVISIAQLSESYEAAPVKEMVFEPPAVPDAPAAAPAPARPAKPAAEEEQTAEPRLIYSGLESVTRAARCTIRVQLEYDGREFQGEAAEMDAGQGRVRAAAAAALRAATAACLDSIRLELEQASVVKAHDRDYVLVSALAISPLLGRRPVPLVGAQPLETGDLELTAALAALKAGNRVLGLGLRAPRPQPARRRDVRA